MRSDLLGMKKYQHLLLVGLFVFGFLFVLLIDNKTIASGLVIIFAFLFNVASITKKNIRQLNIINRRNSAAFVLGALIALLT